MEAIAYSILAVILVLGGVAGVLALAFAAYIRLSHHRETYRAIRLMRERGRLLSPADFEQRIAMSKGTAIFEYPTLGWRVVRVWWTPDDVAAMAAGISEQSSDSAGSEPSPFEIWCHDSYTDFQNGRALLVPLYLFGSAYYRFTEALCVRFPTLKSVRVRSAIVHFTRTSSRMETPE